MEHRNASKSRKKQHRRLPDYDYRTSGAYSITICTRNRQPFFHIPELQQLLNEQWSILPERFPEVTLYNLVIMPDHIHCLLSLTDEIEEVHSVSDIMGAYKSLVNVNWLRYIHEHSIHGPYTLWQTSFHDHIVRNPLDFQEKQQYIENNPLARELKDQHLLEEKRHQHKKN